VTIEGSRLQTPPAHLVPELVEDMCDYLNARWEGSTAFHLSAYAMWRLNAIHPFTDGNGRTSRIFSYFVLCARLGYILPGENSIPAQIEADRKPYFDALEAADRSFEQGRLDVSMMEALLDGLLARQFLDVLNRASGANRA
jgi:Fic family protein